MNNTEKPSKKLKMAAGLVASAAAATVAAMAYKVNEEKINEGVDKVADTTKNFIEKASKKVKDLADDIVAMADEDLTEEEKEAAVAAEAEVVEVTPEDEPAEEAFEEATEEPATDPATASEEEKTE